MRLSSGGRKPRTGCVVLAAVVAAAAIVAGLLVGFAALQNRQVRLETRTIERSVPDTEGDGTGSTAAGVSPVVARLIVDVAVAQAYLFPTAPGEPIRVEASYDPEDYVLEQSSTRDDDRQWTYRVALLPRGPRSWALLRAKVGNVLPRLRIAVPADVELDLTGTVDRGYAAVELGGSSVRATTLEADDGAVSLSFASPLRHPMDSLVMRGSKGSLEVTGLGNASPTTASFAQRLGAIDLDLRGPWSRDASITVETRFAGGTLWLPEDCRIVGLDETEPLIRREAEVRRPTLSLTLPASHRNLIVVH